MLKSLSNRVVCVSFRKLQIVSGSFKIPNKGLEIWLTQLDQEAQSSVPQNCVKPDMAVHAYKSL